MFGYQAMDMGLSVVKGVTSFLAQRDEAKSKRAWQRYKNTMLNISGGRAKNALVANQNMAVERSSMQAVEIDKSEYTTLASAEVAAAAAGVEGRSVNQTMFQIQANAASAQAARERDLTAQLLGFQQQRENVDMQVAMQTDITPIPTPNVASTLLGIGTELWSTHKAYNKIGKGS